MSLLFPKSRSKYRNEWSDLLIALFCSAALAYGSLLPFEFHVQTFSGAYQQFFERLGVDLELLTASDIFGNFLLYLPIGFCWMKLLQRHLRPIGAALLALFICLSLSLGLEFAQAWQRLRFCSAFDFLVNSSGALVGIGLCVVVSACLRVVHSQWPTRFFVPMSFRRRNLQGCWVCVVLAYVALLCSVFLRPFELDVSFAAIQTSFSHLFELPFIELQKKSYFVALLLIGEKIALFVPLGALLMFAIFTSPKTARQRNRSLRYALIGMVLFAVAIESLQALLRTRFPASSDVVLYLFGASLGAYIAVQLVVRERFRVRPQSRLFD